MRGVNKVILIGNLGADPEVRYTPSGQAVATLRIATTETWSNRENGQREQKTEWHRVVVWGKQAENCSQYLSKGRQIYVEGRIQTRNWTDKEGNTRYTTEIVANNVQFLGSRAQESDQPGIEPEMGVAESGGFEANTSTNLDDDIPF